jgi:hypothetical protein
MLRRSLSVVLAACLALSTTACGSLHVAYAPSSAAAAPATGTAVKLKVVDARPADQGGEDKAVVGQVRSGVGIPNAMKDSDPNAVTRTVTEATSDALRQAGVAGGKGDKTLVATVKEFWMDGYAGYKGKVVVDYALQDGSGATLWQKTLTGSDGAALVMKSSYGMTEDIFKKALANLATSAATEFQTAEFQAAAK